MISYPWVATCARGLEPILFRELSWLGCHPQEPDVGGVCFRGGIEDAVRACWRLRTANRVLLELARFPARDGAELYWGIVHAFQEAPKSPLSLAALAHPERTLAFRATSQRSQLRDTRWVCLRAKDALVDAQRQRFGKRSSVSEDPDLPLRIRLLEDEATLLLDLVGESLDHRHYRLRGSIAPVRETLAAALVFAAEVSQPGVVVDPMCGSGTLLAEAAAFYLGLPPLRLRQRWKFEDWPGFSEALTKVRSETFPTPAPETRFLGWDRDPLAIQAARTNLRAAGLEHHIELEVADAWERFKPANEGLLLLNPPFGNRLTIPDLFWPRLGDWLKKHWSGWRVALLAGDPKLVSRLGLRPSKQLAVWDGPLDARIAVLDLFAGSWKARKLRVSQKQATALQQNGASPAGGCPSERCSPNCPP